MSQPEHIVSESLLEIRRKEKAELLEKEIEDNAWDKAHVGGASESVVFTASVNVKLPTPVTGNG